MEWRRTCSDRESLTRALVAEVRAIHCIVSKRRYIENLRQLIKQAEESPDVDTSPRFFFSVRWEPFAVYTANVGKIGLLRGELASLIPEFFVHANAILDDIRDMQEGRPERSRDDAIRVLKELLALFEDADAVARQILKLPPDEGVTLAQGPSNGA